MIQKPISPLSDSSVNQALYVLDSGRQIEEKLSSMSEAILCGSWVRFNTLYHELMDFKPSQKCLNGFGKEQMKITVARNPTFGELVIIREELASIGISDDELEDGYQYGLRILQSHYLSRILHSVLRRRRN